MKRFVGVSVLVCVCVLLSVSLVQCRRRRIPGYCRKYISYAQTHANHFDTSTHVDDDDDIDDIERDDDEEAEVDDPMRIALDEINMLRLTIDFMG